MQVSIYRCFLPDLTGFIALRRVGPGPQPTPAQPVPYTDLEAGIQPRYSGLRVQGTAGSPPSTTKPILIRKT